MRVRVHVYVGDIDVRGEGDGESMGVKKPLDISVKGLCGGGVWVLETY